MNNARKYFRIFLPYQFTGTTFCNLSIYSFETLNVYFPYSNVSKENYSFSDYPFPDETEDFPHNAVMADYVRDYTKHFGVDKLIKFHMQVNKLTRKGWCKL